MELGPLIEEFMINYGLLSIFIIVALEYANVPLPSELVLPLAGILALKYGMRLGVVILVSILGGIFGSIINYYLGYKFGNPILYYLKSKYPKTKKAIRESYRWIGKYEKSSVMISRLVPLARTFISIVAGVIKMDMLVFLIYSAIGISIWNTFLIGIGYIVGDNMDKIAYILGNYTKTVALLLFVGIIIGLITIRKKVKNKNDKSTLIESKEV